MAEDHRLCGETFRFLFGPYIPPLFEIRLRIGQGWLRPYSTNSTNRPYPKAGNCHEFRPSLRSFSRSGYYEAA
jgi:hypothetical protein